MAITTYDELKTALNNWLDRSEAEGRIDEFIDLAEARHKRPPERDPRLPAGGIRIKEMMTRTSLTVNDRYIDLPAGFLEANGLRLLTNPVTVLTEVNPYEMSRLRQEGTGKPKFFTIHSQIEFDRSPDEDYSGEMLHFAALTALSDGNTTNDLLTRAPDAYLYAALAASAPFLMHDERIQVWERVYKEVSDGLNKQRTKIGPLVSRVVGSTP